MTETARFNNLESYFPSLDPTDLELVNRILLKAFYVRFSEEKLLWAYARGKIRGTVHTCLGQELQSAMLGIFTNSDFDWVFSNHRGHGHFLSFNGNAFELFSELLGKKNGPSGGNGGSQHIHKGRFFTNGVQGGFMPISAGVAESVKEELGNSFVSTYIGDGTLGEGSVWETLNIAALRRLPLLTICEDNKIAQSTPSGMTFAGNLESRVTGFGLKYYSASFVNPEQLFLTIKNAVHEIRHNKEPIFLHLESIRLGAHSKGDDNRDPIELNKNTENDFLTRFRSKCNQSDLDILEGIISQVENEYQRAEISENGEVDLQESIPIAVDYSEMQKNHDGPLGLIKHRDSIYGSLRTAFEEFPNLAMYGEDIEYMPKGTKKPYGGAFKVTQNLSNLFPGRVFNMPISEAALVGFGIGRALSGKETIIEIMFGDFLSLGFDQILQQLSKIPSMYGDSISLPIIIRTPMGGGFGYGATHSQSIEKHFLGIPNVRVVAPTVIESNSHLVSKLIALNSPTILIENKRDYLELEETSIPVSHEHINALYFLNYKSETKVLIVAYGGMSKLALRVKEVLLVKFEIGADVVILKQLSPLSFSLDLLKDKYEYLISIEEGIKEHGIGGEILANLLESEVKIDSLIRIGAFGIFGTLASSEERNIPNLDWVIKIIQQRLDVI